MEGKLMVFEMVMGILLIALSALMLFIGSRRIFKKGATPDIFEVIGCLAGMTAGIIGFVVGLAALFSASPY